MFGKLNASKYSWPQLNIASKDGRQWLIYLARNTTDIAKAKTNLVLSYSITKWKVCDFDANAVQWKSNLWQFPAANGLLCKQYGAIYQGKKKKMVS